MPFPRTVIIASAALTTCAVLSAADVLTGLVALDRLDGDRRWVEALSDWHSGNLADLRSSTWVNLALGVAGLVILGVLGKAVRHRSEGWRIGALIALSALVVTTVYGVAQDRSGIGTPDASLSPSEREALLNLFPSWYESAHSVYVFLLLVGLVVAGVSLMRESSRDYHRRMDGEFGLTAGRAAEGA